MKTIETNKVENYIYQTKKHLFLIDDEEYKIIANDNFVISIRDKYIRVFDLNKIEKEYLNNTKNVMKGLLFNTPRWIKYELKDIKSIRMYKAARIKYAEIEDAIKGIKDREEVIRIVNEFI